MLAVFCAFALPLLVLRCRRGASRPRVMLEAASAPYIALLLDVVFFPSAAAIIEQAHAGHKLSDKGINPTRFVRGLSVSSSTQPG